MVRFGGVDAPATEIRFVQQVRDPDAEAHAAQGVVPDGVFIRAADGTEVDATQPVNAVIEIQQQSQGGSTFLLGHELAHNLLDVLRRTGTLTEEMDAALAERFKDAEGKFDEEAFADAFGAELRDAFTLQEDARLNEPQGGKVRKILRTLACAVRNWIYAVNAMAWRREAQSVADSAGSPQNVASVLDAFLRKEAGAAASGAQQDQGAGTAPTGNRSESPNSSAQGAKYHVPPPADENIAIANEGVTEETFTASLDKMLQERVADGRIVVRPEGVSKLKNAAKTFFRDFRNKKVSLSDGRSVYFVPTTNKGRGLSNSDAWAEYAIHAETNAIRQKNGKMSRSFNPRKLISFEDISRILKEENVSFSLSNNPVNDVVVFHGEVAGKKLDIVTRLDEAGNIQADLSEITTVVKGKGRKDPPSVPLREAVQSVLMHQGAGAPQTTYANDAKYHIAGQAVDAAYISAVERNDTRETRRMVQDAALEAGAVEDGDGYPFLLYHGSPNAFTTFNEGSLIWATPFKEYASRYGDEVMPLYAFSENVLDIGELNVALVDSDGKPSDETRALAEKVDVAPEAILALAEENWDATHSDEIWAATSTPRFREIVERAGFDAVLAQEGGIPTVGVVKPSQYKSAAPVAYDDAGNVVPLSERFNADNPDIRFHIPSPTERFSETEAGKRVVAEVLDALIETNPAFVFDRERAVDAEANASEGKKKQLDETLKRLDGIRQGLSAEQWQDVLGTAFEVSGRFDVLGETNGVITPVVRERMAGYLQDIVRNRATMLGRRAYMAGRNFAWRRAREEHGEVLRSLSEKRAKERKGLREDISRLEGDLKDVGREYRELETQAEGLQARVNYLSDVIDALNADKADLRERMREAVRTERVRQARKDAVRREVGVTSKQLKDVEQVKLAYSDTDIETAAGEMVKRATSRVGRLRILG